MKKRLRKLLGLKDRDAELRHLARTIEAVDAYYRNEIEALKKEFEVTSTKDTSAQVGQLSSALKEMDGFLAPPPKNLQKRVVGGYHPAFLDSGYTLAGNLDEILRRQGRSLADCRKVLEWGCGCGRSLRAIKRLHPDLDLSGTDVDPEAIDWLQQNYGSIATFKTNAAAPPIEFKDNTFDLIYAVSVFTHLPEDMQFQWLGELARLLAPGGIALLSIHGENHHSKQGAEARKVLKEKGFYYDTGALLTDGLPDFYLNSYHTAAYVEREWNRTFDVLEIVSLGFEGHQDVVVVAPKPNTG